jgi:lipopolysaccharide transport system ATP-binding protein
MNSITRRQPGISVDNVSKSFVLHPERARSFQTLFLNAVRGQRARRGDVLWALRDVSFRISAGEAVGLIGLNGSGKSTCLKLLARIIPASTGKVAVSGRLSALLELGAGFHPELTGRENIFLYGAVLGVSRRDLAARFDEIVAFAELERFVDVPVKFYSSGMYVRLGFATAISVQPEILLIDEVLAVGDQGFQDKCLNRIRAMQAEGVTIVFVSHDLGAVQGLCERSLWFDQGRLQSDGPSASVIGDYVQALHDRGLLAAAPVAPTDSPDLLAPEISPPAPPEQLVRRRHGSLVARIVHATFRDAVGLSTSCLEARASYTLALEYETDEVIPEPVFGFAVHTTSGLHVTGTNSALCGLTLAPLRGRGLVTFAMPDLNLAPGEYVLSVALHSVDEQQAYDYQDHAYPFTIKGSRSLARGEGLAFIPGQWQHRPDTDGGRVSRGAGAFR